MATVWTYSHPATAVAVIKSTADVYTQSAVPASSAWAADLVAKCRLAFAQLAQQIPGRTTQIAFSATQDSSGSLTISATVS